MAAKKRIRKHDLKEDHFVTATFQLTTYIRERQNLFLAVAAVIVVVAIIIAVVTSSRSRTQQTAARILGEIEMMYQQGALNEVVERSQVLIDQYGGTSQAGTAVFYLADSHMKMGQFHEAIDGYQLYIDKHHRDETMTASSYTGMAVCYEFLDEFYQAGEHYFQAAQKFPRYYGSPEALLNAGRCFTTSGEFSKAKGSYQKLIDEYPESRLVSDATMALAELQAKSPQIESPQTES
jgi:TolA-binding protein